MDFASHFPSCISKEELAAVSLDFELRFDRIVDKILDQDSDPDELRRYAKVLDNLGDWFAVDVSSGCEILHEHASEIEGGYREEDGGDYDSWRNAAWNLHKKKTRSIPCSMG